MKASSLTPDQLISWRKRHGLSQSALAKKLGLSHSSIFSYEKGTREDADVKIPLLVCLGLSAISSGLIPYEGEKTNVDSNQSSPQS